jgi:hypothetical protein
LCPAAGDLTALACSDTTPLQEQINALQYENKELRVRFERSLEELREVRYVWEFASEMETLTPGRGEKESAVVEKEHASLMHQTAMAEEAARAREALNDRLAMQRKVCCCLVCSFSAVVSSTCGHARCKHWKYSWPNVTAPSTACKRNPWRQSESAGRCACAPNQKPSA